MGELGAMTRLPLIAHWKRPTPYWKNEALTTREIADETIPQVEKLFLRVRHG